MVQPTAGENEESSFLSVQRFLEKLALPVPRVYLHDPQNSIIIMEDLGEDLLETLLSGTSQTKMRALYEEAVDILIRMRAATREINTGCVAFDLAFDEAKLMEEMRFFMTHFVRGFCGTEPSAHAAAMLHDFFARICTMLAAEPRVFTHRDYHSRNLMLHNGRLVMIDFQDARMGPAQYDLASLLRDSYTALPEPLVDDLLKRYAEALDKADGNSLDRFRYVFDMMSLQRNIKALGTFGYQFTVRGTSRYLPAISRTGTYIARNIALYEELAGFRQVVEDYISGPALRAGDRGKPS